MGRNNHDKDCKNVNSLFITSSDRKVPTTRHRTPYIIPMFWSGLLSFTPALNPLIPKTDQHQISPGTINAL